jgi:O-antigen ligase
MQPTVEGEGSGIRRGLQLIVLSCPALTIAVKGGANGSLMLAAALSLWVLLRQPRPAAGAALGGDAQALRAYALAMAAPVWVLLAVQSLHGGPWAVGAVSSSARFLLAVPLVIVAARIGLRLAPWADASFALGALGAGAVMLLAPREWSPGRWGSAFLDPINFGGLAVLLGVLSLLSVDWRRRDPLPLRLLKIGGFAAGLGASIPTGARGPWLAMLVLIAVLALTTLRGRRPALRVALWGSLAAAMLVAFATVDALRGRFDLMAADLGGFFWGGERDTSPGIRLQIWRAALLAFAERPLLGLGGGGFAAAVDGYLAAGVLSPLAAEAARAEMHNSYLAYATDFGLPGLLAVTAVFAVPAAAFARGLGGDPLRRRAALMGLVVVTLYAACAISVDVFKLKMMAAFYAAATAFLAAMALGGPAGNGQHGQGRSGALPRQAS